MLVVAAGAQASLTTFYGLRDTGIGAPSAAPLTAKTAFLTNVINPGTENFSGFAVGAPVFPGVTLGVTFTGNGNTATISGTDIGTGLANFVVLDNASGNPLGRYDTTGSGDCCPQMPTA